MEDIERARQVFQATRLVLKCFSKKGCLPAPPSISVLDEKGGLFLTLTNTKTGKLTRYGSYLGSMSSIRESVARAAMDACGRNDAFPPATQKEIGGLLLELCLISGVSRLKLDESALSKDIRPGEHGLAIDGKKGDGLLIMLPLHTAGRKPLDIMESLCLSAGLSRNAWKRENTAIYSFSTVCFRENKPSGRSIVSVSQEQCRVIEWEFEKR